MTLTKAKAEKRNAADKKSKRNAGQAMVEDLLKRYMADIQSYPILTREEETELALHYQQTQDSEAAMRLVQSNLRLVVKIALEYRANWVNPLDLIQEGNLGLMRAVQKFDPERNIRLSSYAQWWIRAFILKYLMDNYKLVKIGTTQAQRKLFYNLRKERENLIQQGVTPDTQTLADKLNVTEAEVTEMETRLTGREVSLDAPINDGEPGSLIDFVASNEPRTDDVIDRHYTGQMLLDKLEDFRSTLSGRDIKIWDLRLLNDSPMTLQQLGEMFGVSRERARQLEARILNKLGKFLNKELSSLNDVDFEFPLFN